MGRGLGWVTHRGPFQPQPVCDSVLIALQNWGLTLQSKSLPDLPVWLLLVCSHQPGQKHHRVTEAAQRGGFGCGSWLCRVFSVRLPAARGACPPSVLCRRPTCRIPFSHRLPVASGEAAEPWCRGYPGAPAERQARGCSKEINGTSVAFLALPDGCRTASASHLLSLGATCSVCKMETKTPIENKTKKKKDQNPITFPSFPFLLYRKRFYTTSAPTKTSYQVKLGSAVKSLCCKGVNA